MTHAEAVLEELKPVRRMHTEEISERLPHRLNPMLEQGKSMMSKEQQK